MFVHFFFFALKKMTIEVFTFHFLLCVNLFLLLNDRRLPKWQENTLEFGRRCKSYMKWNSSRACITWTRIRFNDKSSHCIIWSHLGKQMELLLARGKALEKHAAIFLYIVTHPKKEKRKKKKETKIHFSRHLQLKLFKGRPVLTHNLKKKVLLLQNKNKICCRKNKVSLYKRS